MHRKTPTVLSPVDKRQQHLGRQCFWDEVDQVLYIDARKLFPKEGVVSILGWDNMMLNAFPIPQYPDFFSIMRWANHSQLSDWRKQIPKWVQDSCALFPSHQMMLLHYAGKYPQVLELLDHAPLMAWRLVSSKLDEPEIVALLAGKRTQIAESIGWPGKADTVKFLTSLRLRWVDKHIAEQIDVCVFDDQRLTALQHLPRINSMALTLAARFPELIGSQLHHALAQLPCRPMQCQSMVALLEDAYRLAEFMQLDKHHVDRIGESRFLVEVERVYQHWLNQLVESAFGDHKAEESLTESAKVETAKADLCRELGSMPKLMKGHVNWLALSMLQQHAWLTDYDTHIEENKRLFAWRDDEGIWSALIHIKVRQGGAEQDGKEKSTDRIRGLANALPTAKQLSTLHLWQAQAVKQD